MAAFFAVLVTVADVVLAGAFAGAFGLLWIPANLLVTAGCAPSLWMAREVPFWRWPALGAGVGAARGVGRDAAGAARLTRPARFAGS